MDKNSKEKIRELKAQIKAEKKANKGSGKVRFKGLCKVLLGLAMLSPAPACLAVGVTLAVNGDAEFKQAHAEYVATPYYKEAMAERDAQLADLEIKHAKKEISDKFYEVNKDYYDYSYVQEVQDNSEQGAILKRTDDKKTVGVVLATAGTLGGIILSVLFGAITCEATDDKYAQFGLIKSGGKEFASGEKDYGF